MKIQNYLHFEGATEEAVEFYQSALGAQVLALWRFKDAPPAANPHSFPGEKIIYTRMQVGESILMATDGGCSGEPHFEGIELTLIVDDEADAKSRFAAPSEGGQMKMPLGATFFSPCYGIVADRFGVTWKVSTQ